jgi:hypothetical protein
VAAAKETAASSVGAGASNLRGAAAVAHIEAVGGVGENIGNTDPNSGYTCGLWFMFHYLTVGKLSLMFWLISPAGCVECQFHIFFSLFV